MSTYGKLGRANTVVENYQAENFTVLQSTNILDASYMAAQNISRYIFLYIRSGADYIVTSSASYKVCANQLILVSPYESLEIPNKNNLSIFLLSTNQQCALINIINALPSRPIISLGAFSSRIQEYIENYEIDNSSYPQSASVSLSLINLILSFTERTLTSGQIETTAFNPEVCHYVKDYIDKHYGSKINFNELANQLYINQDYMTHLFRKYTGIPPTKYLLNKRLEKASELLLSSNLSIAEIADKVGYSDPNHFSFIYKKNTGIAPTSYRQNIR